MVPYTFYLVIAAVLFVTGLIGVTLRRNAIVVLMCVEMMLNAVNLTFVTFSRISGNLEGQLVVFFVMVIAASEAAVGLAIVISLFRSTKGAETTNATELQG